MAEYDGEVVLSMKVTPEEVKKSSEQLSSEVKKIFEVGANTTLDKKAKDLLNTLDKLNNKVVDASKNLDEALNKKVPTAEYQELVNAETEAEKELDRLVNKQKMLVEKNSLRPITTQYQELCDKLKEQKADVDRLTETFGPYNKKVIESQNAYIQTEQAIAKIKPQIDAMAEAETLLTEKVEKQKEKVQDVKDSMEDLVKAGKAFTLDYSAITKAKNEENELNNQIRIANEQTKEYINNLNGQSKEQRVANTLKELENQHSRELLKSMKIENEEVYKKSQELQNLEYKLDSLKAKQESMPKTLGPGTQQFREITQEIVKTEREYEKLKAEIDAYVEKMQTLPTKSKGVIEAFKQIPKMIADVFKHLPSIVGNVFNKVLSVAKSVLTKIPDLVKKIPNAVQNGVKAFTKLSSAILQNIPGIKQMTSLVGKLGNKLLGLGKNADASSINFKKLFSTILRYGLGIRGLFMLFRKLRSAIVEGMNNLAQTKGGMNQTNQALSQLMSSLNALKNAWGAAFAPILQVVAPILAKFIDMLTQFANKIAMFTSALIGKTTAIVAKKQPANYAESLDKSGTASGRSQQEKYDKAVKKAQDKYDKQMESVTEKRAKAQAKAEEKQAKAAEKLAKKQEKANQQLGAYDKLNVIAKDDAEELTEVQATQYDDPELELPNLEDYMQGMTDFDSMFEEVPIESAIKDLLDRIKEAWNSGDFTELGAVVGEKLMEKLNQATDWIVNVAQPFATKLGTAIATFTNGLVKVDGLAASFGETLGEVLNTCADFMTGILDNLDFEAIGNFIADGIVSFINTVDFSQMGHNFAQWYNGLFDMLKGFTDNWDPDAFAKAVGDFVNTAINDFNWGKNGKTLGEFAKKFFETISKAIKAVEWNKLGTDIADMIESVDWEGVATSLFDALGAALGGLMAFLVGLVDDAMNGLVEWWYENAYKNGEFSIQGLFDGILNALKGLGEWIKKNIFDPFIKGFEEAFKINSPSKVLEDEGGFLMDGLKQGVKDKIESIKKIFTDLKNKIVSVFNSLKSTVISVWNSMWSGIKGVINSILGGVEKMANGVIRGFNKMISAINNLSLDIPDWVPEIGGRTLGFHIPEMSTVSIPRLAQGAVIPPNKEFLAMLGDQNKGMNVEAPLDTIVDAVTQALDKREGVSNHEPIVLQLDSRTVAECVWDEEEKRYKQRGSSYSPMFT